MGGEDSRNGYYQKTIIKFDPDKMDWEVMDVELKDARRFLTAFMVPDNYVTCD